MSVIIILITASLLIAIGFLIAFFWAVKNNQFEDDYTPSVRILLDNTLNKPEVKNNISITENKSLENNNIKFNANL